jgi:3-oxoacyl-[acyl-carrier protein] reductase
VACVLIIGASSSLGNSVIKAFLDTGYDVLATYNSQPLRDNSEENFFPFHLDLSSEESISNFYSAVSFAEWNIDVCILLSGVLPGKNLQDYETEEMDHVMSVNFTGFSKTLKYLQPMFGDESQVIIVSSVSAERGSYDPIYAASKGALISFMKSLSQCKPLRIRANAITPGLIEDSTMFDDMSPSRQAVHLSKSPTGKLTKIEDLSQIIVDISKPHWRNMNGAVIKVNGGTYV